TFPFFDPEVLAAPDNRLLLYRRGVSVQGPRLYFVGLLPPPRPTTPVPQPLGPIMPIAEAQSEWIADLISGRAALPSAAEMKKEIAVEEGKQAKRFVASKRHTVEVDFYPYLREIRRERKRDSARA